MLCMGLRKSDCTIAATGDAMITRKITPYEGNDPDFDRMLSVLREADSTVTNLEMLVHDHAGYPAATSGGTYMRAPPYVLDELARVGVDMCAAATNHTFDYSHGGIEAMIRHFNERELVAAGIGHNRFEARKPAYVETSAGRVALIAAASTFPPGSEAGEQSPALQGRPGLNPLHVDRIYQIPESRLGDIQEISELSGFADVKESWLDRGHLAGEDWDESEYVHLGRTKFRPVESDSDAGVAYDVNEIDLAALLESIVEAKAQADHVVMSLHTHQGTGGRQTTKETPGFLRLVAHECIDAGASMFVAHGPHVVRGVEVYNQAPICYSLGHWIVQNETVERAPPESYHRYGLEEYTKVSRIFEARLRDAAGDPKGDLANDSFWEAFIPECTFEDGELAAFKLHPITLHGDAERPQRGLPKYASGDDARRILKEIADYSTEFGTKITMRDEVGHVEL